MKPSQKLKNEWARKLKESGFKDIERDTEVDLYSLKSWSLDFGRDHKKEDENINVKIENKLKYHIEGVQTKFNSRQDYYYYAEHFLNEYKFESDKDRIIWDNHSRGVAMRSISKILNKLYRKKHTTYFIFAAVKRMSTIMKQKYLK